MTPRWQKLLFLPEIPLSWTVEGLFELTLLDIEQSIPIVVFPPKLQNSKLWLWKILEQKKFMPKIQSF